ncbi:hypothetical protein GCM10027049_22850 [Mucilaginibacter puniceus]
MLLFSITWGAVSGWWTPACLLLGLLYAWLMYRHPVNLGEKVRYALFAARALVVFLIAFLLISPLIQSVNYQPEKPLVLVAQDNSQSINTFKTKDFNAQQFITDLGKLKNKLGEEYEVREFNFTRDVNSGLSNTFNGKQTDISAALRGLNDRFVNQNIGAVILATDGSYNQGSDPQYEARGFKSNIYTIALGDTIARRDLLVGNVNYNKTAFLDNDFIIEVLAEAYQSKGENMSVTVTQDGRQVFNQIIAVTSNDFKRTIPVKLTADRKGVRKFNIRIAPIKNELSTQNNEETIYIEVLDARQKIIVLFDNPHPDITVIKQAIEANKNYEVKSSLVADLAGVKLTDYSLAILHQLTPNSFSLLRDFLKGKTPVWYMLGGQSDAGSFNTQQKIIRLNVLGNVSMQEVFAMPVADFASFTFSDSTVNKIAQFPPLMAPYGSYGVSGSVLFKQKIGSVPTTYPLLAFGTDNGKRVAASVGEGFWKWNLAEFKTYGNHHALEELFSQSVQYLTANANQQKFRVYPSKNVFDEGENVLLNGELYNDALEPVNTPDVRIDLKNTQGKNFNFLFTKNGTGYQLNAGALPVGEYTYAASTKLGDRLYNAAGQLTIKPLNLELRQSAANHQLLRDMAKQSGGKMLYPSQVDELADLILKNENIKTLVYENKHYNDIIDVKWIFFLLLLLLSGEWFMRKREGEI